MLGLNCPLLLLLKERSWGEGRKQGGQREKWSRGRGWGGKARGEVLGLGVGAVLVRRPGAGRQVVEGRSGLVLIAVATRGHPLVDEVQTSSFLEALNLVLWVEALNSCQNKRNNQNHQSTARNVIQSE